MADQSFSDPRIERYLATITPVRGDPTYSILKGHLLFEELLVDYVSMRLQNASGLKDVRLSFAQTLALVIAFEAPGAEAEWSWEAIRRLNSLRNKLAHTAVLADVRAKSEELAKFIVEKLGQPLPPALMQVKEEDGTIGATYTRIDIAMIGLYGYLHGKLDGRKKRALPLP